MTASLDTLEICPSSRGDRWVRVDPWIFRSWGGPRRKNGEAYTGPVFVLGSDRVAS